MKCFLLGPNAKVKKVFHPTGHDKPSSLEESIQSQFDHTKRAILYRASEHLCGLFLKFVNRTRDRLKHKVSAKDLSTFVLTTLNCLRMEYPADLEDKLNACEDVGGVLRELTREGCDVIVFHNIDVLELIIEEYFGEADEELKKYNEELEMYLRRRICEHHLFEPSVVGTEVMSVSENAKLYIFMDSTWTRDMSLRKFHKFETRLATILQCRCIQLIEIRVGSLLFCYNTLEKDFTHTAIPIEHILSLINCGVKVLSEEIGGRKHSKQMEKACKHVMQNINALLSTIRFYLQKYIDV